MNPLLCYSAHDLENLSVWELMITKQAISQSRDSSDAFNSVQSCLIKTPSGEKGEKLKTCNLLTLLSQIAVSKKKGVELIRES